MSEIELDKTGYYIFRGRDSGVFAGNLLERNGQEVKIGNVRRLWFWEGACSLSQLAKEGTKKPSECQFSVEVEEITILDCIEIDKCTSIAEENIRSVKDWKI